MSAPHTIRLPYGIPGLSSVTVPASNLGDVYLPKSHPVVASIPDAVNGVLSAPTGSAPLDVLVRRLNTHSATVSVIVDDMTRMTPVAQILPSVLDRLEAAGISRERIVITVALGTHRIMTDRELAVRVGNAVFREYRVENSHFYDPRMMTRVGESEEGVPIFIDKTVASADFRIGIGSIVPHGAVGWSGGGKILYPGVAGQETVKRFHYLHGVTRRNMKGLRDCSVRTTMERWVEKIGLDFIVNTVLDQNGAVSAVVGGHYIAAQRRGVDVAEKIYLYRGERRSDVVIAVSHPHDADFWQAAKGIYSGEQCCVPGGDVILATPCHEGEGNHPRFLERSTDDSVHDLLRRVLNGEEAAVDDPVSVAPACLVNQISKTKRIHLVSPGLDRERVETLGFSWSNSVQETIDTILARRPNARISAVLHSDLSFSDEHTEQRSIAP